jgi:integrase
MPARRRVVRQVLATFEMCGFVARGLGEWPTGLRNGELPGLQVEDIDISGALLHIRRTFFRGEVVSPKTVGSTRTIPLTDELGQILRDYLGQRTNGSLWLFPTSTGNPWDDRTLFNRRVKPVCTKLGARFSWHSLRHTFSTL